MKESRRRIREREIEEDTEDLRRERREREEK
jgi:hypothetical protein